MRWHAAIRSCDFGEIGRISAFEFAEIIRGTRYRAIAQIFTQSPGIGLKDLGDALPGRRTRRRSCASCRGSTRWSSAGIRNFPRDSPRRCRCPCHRRCRRRCRRLRRYRRRRHFRRQLRRCCYRSCPSFCREEDAPRPSVRAIHQDDSLTGHSLAHFRRSSAIPQASPPSDVCAFTWHHVGSTDRFRVAGKSAAIASLRGRSRDRRAMAGTILAQGRSLRSKRWRRRPSAVEWKNVARRSSEEHVTVLSSSTFSVGKERTRLTLEYSMWIAVPLDISLWKVILERLLRNLQRSVCVSPFSRSLSTLCNANDQQSKCQDAVF